MAVVLIVQLGQSAHGDRQVRIDRREERGEVANLLIACVEGDFGDDAPRLRVLG